MPTPKKVLDIPSIPSSIKPPSALIQEDPSDLMAPQMSPLSHVTELEIHGDDRSSSLSDIEDRHIVEAVENSITNNSTISDADDTEAETERLEESPQKLRKHENVVFTATQKPSHGIPATDNGGYSEKNGNEFNAPASGSMPDLVHSDPDDDPMDQTSDISSLEDTAEEASRAVSPLNVSGRKRKRPSPETLAKNDSAIVKSLKQAAEHLASNMIQDNDRPEAPELASSVKEEAVGDHIYDEEEDEVSAGSGYDATALLQPTLCSNQNSQRIEKGINERDSRAVNSRTVSPGIEDIDADGDAADSGGEDEDMDDVVHGMGIDATARNDEEGM